MATAESLKRVRELAEEPSRLDEDDLREWKRLIDIYNRERLAKGQKAIDWRARVEDDHRIEVLAELRDKIEEENPDELEGGCGDGGPCGNPDIDLDNLAELVFRRLVFEARIEAQRTGWLA